MNDASAQRLAHVLARLARRPDDAGLHHEAALLHLAQGAPASARPHLERATALEPRSADFWNDLGGVQLALGETAQAIESYRRALSLRPGYTEARVNLGHAHYAAGDRQAAIATFEAVVAQEARNYRALYNLAVVQRQCGNLEAAASAYARALAVEPDSVAAHFSLAEVHAQARRFEAAAAEYRETLRRAPAHAEAKLGLGRSLVAAWHTEEGRAHLETLVQWQPRSVPARLELARALQVAGDLRGAEQQCRLALELDPVSTSGWLLLSSVASFSQGGEADLRRMEALLANAGQSPENCMRLHFALGKAYDDLGEYQTAFEHYRQGNEAKCSSLAAPSQDFASQVEDILSSFTPALLGRLASEGLDSELPVLVVGMPRSGTTLAEQIIASHPRAHGAGELSYFASLVPHLATALPGVSGYPAGCAALDASALRRIGEPYLALLRRHSASAERVVDKMPGNYVYLGLIAGVFPRARLVHCRRDPMDTCLSIYFQLFAHGHDYAYDLRTLGERYRQYLRLMGHWEALLGDRLYTHVYEDLLADPESGARGLVQAAGLDWQPECLAFHTRRRDVRTASVAQVRQPLYTRSRERWRNYERWLGPLQEGLEGR